MEQLGVKQGEDGGGGKLGLTLMWKPRGLWMGRMGNESRI